MQVALQAPCAGAQRRFRKSELRSSRLVPRVDPAAAAASADQVVGGSRSPGAPLVGCGVAARLPGLDQRVHDLPGALDLLATREDGVAAAQHLAEDVVVG